MKHTFIFIVANGVTEDNLYRLAVALNNRTVSYKSSHSNCRYDRVQVFTSPVEMHLIAHTAGFSGEQLRVALPAARRRGDAAVGLASKRLDALRKRAMHGIRYSTERLNLRLTPEQKELYEGVAGKRNLSKWILKTLDRAAIAPIQMPGGTKRSKRSA